MTERQLTLHKPSLSGDQQLFVRRIEGREAISELYAYEVILYSKSDNVDFAKVLGQEMCVGLMQAKGDKERFFHGYVASFANIGTEGGFHLYRAELRPNMWRLTRSINCRAYQGEAVPDIVASVLKAHGIDGTVQSLSRTYLPWEYCVQYRESDFAFISRLLEREGIHYFFKHEKGKHTLHLADTNQHETTPGYDEVAFKLDGTHHPGEESVWGLTLSKHVLTDRTTLSDYDFTKPKEPLSRTSGSEVKRDNDDARDYEGYDFLETVVQQTGYSADLTEEYARIRSEEIHSHYAVAAAETNARGLVAGHCFKLKEHRTTARNIEYLILSTHVHAEIDERGSTTGSHSELLYRCAYESIDAKTPFRPARVTPKPRIPGPQSATVAGPAGAKDIHTDQWGRVLVKFHWYRPPESIDKDISFWVRVSQNSAGANWGSLFMPHIGQEVIVSFYEGDPDRPVVTGRVYNGNNKPPLTLPTFAVKSIIRDHFGNEVLWDATEGAECMAVRSPKEQSSICLGDGGVQMFTEADKATLSMNSKQYSLGFSQNYAMGSSFEYARGMKSSIALGTNLTAFGGSSVGLSVSTSLDFKAGLSVSFVASSSVSYGFARDFKSTKGDYTRVSDDDVQLSSKKVVYIAGGNDHTMFRADATELSLSFDPAFESRAGDFASQDGFAKASTVALTGAATLCAGIGSWQYTMDPQSSRTESKDCDGITRTTVSTDLKLFTSFVDGDYKMMGQALVIAGGIALAGHDHVKPPKHPAPTAKIALKNAEVEIFGSKEKKDARIRVGKDIGISLQAKKLVSVESDDGIKLQSKKGMMITAKQPIRVSGRFVHKYMDISD